MSLLLRQRTQHVGYIAFYNGKQFEILLNDFPNNITRDFT
jgi:hypothetical protein